MPETPSTKETTSPFERLLVDLVRGGVDYAVVGGVAVSLNGFIRATEDLDVLVHEAPGNIRRLLLLKQDSWREKDKLDVAALRKLAVQ